jgi:hypothetical protein
VNRVTPLPTLPDDAQAQAYRLRLHDFLREFATALNQAADQRLWLNASASGAYSSGENDHVVLVTPSAPCTITIPAVDRMIYKRVVVKRANNTTHTITVQSANGNIDGAASTTLTTAYQAKEFYSDGANWWSL